MIEPPTQYYFGGDHPNIWGFIMFVVGPRSFISICLPKIVWGGRQTPNLLEQQHCGGGDPLYGQTNGPFERRLFSSLQLTLSTGIDSEWMRPIVMPATLINLSSGNGLFLSKVDKCCKHMETLYHYLITTQQVKKNGWVVSGWIAWLCCTQLR